MTIEQALKTIRTIEELDGFRKGIDQMGRSLTGTERRLIAIKTAELVEKKKRYGRPAIG